MVRNLPAVLAMGALLACSGAARGGMPFQTLIVEQPLDESLMSLIVAAMAADARLELAAPLYATGAITVANGEIRQLPPRYAGLQPGGQVGITSSRVEVRQGVAWAHVEYRWLSTAEGAAREGIATFLMVPAPAGGVGWRIQHAHSSAPPGA